VRALLPDVPLVPVQADDNEHAAAPSTPDSQVGDPPAESSSTPRAESWIDGGGLRLSRLPRQNGAPRLTHIPGSIGSRAWLHSRSLTASEMEDDGAEGDNA
jgi:hypothetical protein